MRQREIRAGQAVMLARFFHCLTASLRLSVSEPTMSGKPRQAARLRVASLSLSPESQGADAC